MRPCSCRFTIALEPCAGASPRPSSSLASPRAMRSQNPSRSSVASHWTHLVASSDRAMPTFSGAMAGQRRLAARCGWRVLLRDRGMAMICLASILIQRQTRRPPNRLFTVEAKRRCAAMIGTALVQFQLTDPDLARRTSALNRLPAGRTPAQLAPLLNPSTPKPMPTLKARKIQLANFMTASFAPDTGDRIAAITSMSSDTSIEARAVLNQLLSVKAVFRRTRPKANCPRSEIWPRPERG